MAEVLTEASFLVESGVRELVLVAQNTTAYGKDLGIDHGLEDLLEGLTHILGLGWVRVLYGHPDYVTNSIIEVVASHSQLCSYFDIPIQHISQPVLKRMGRRNNSAAIYELFERIRTRVPDAALRTTLMVGFPGESDHDFERLLDLVERVRFDHLGAFVYSDEKDLPSKALKNHVPETVKQQVLMEGSAGGTDSPLEGRTCFQAPEIDGVVYINAGVAEPGTFSRVRITEACEYDLRGAIV
jgi:ribosomal protein S12 methylthiotransferase